MRSRINSSDSSLKYSLAEREDDTPRDMRKPNSRRATKPIFTSNRHIACQLKDTDVEATQLLGLVQRFRVSEEHNRSKARISSCLFGIFSQCGDDIVGNALVTQIVNNPHNPFSRHSEVILKSGHIAKSEAGKRLIEQIPISVNPP